MRKGPMTVNHRPRHRGSAVVSEPDDIDHLAGEFVVLRINVPDVAHAATHEQEDDALCRAESAAQAMHF